MPPNISRVPPPLRITEAARAPVRYEHPYGNPFYDYSRLSSRESPGRGGLTPSSPQLREPRRCRDGRGCRPWLLSIPADSGRHRSNSVKTREKKSLSAGTARGCQRLITAALLCRRGAACRLVCSSAPRGLSPPHPQPRFSAQDQAEKLLIVEDSWRNSGSQLAPRLDDATSQPPVPRSGVFGPISSPTTTTPRCHQILWQLPIDAQRLLAHRTPWGRQQWQPASSTAPAGLHHQRPPHPAATRFCGSSQSTPNAYSLIARLGVDSSGSQHHLRLLQVYITNDHHTPLPPDSVAAPNRRPTPTLSSHALGSTAVAASITHGSCRSTSPTTTTPRCHQILWELPIDAQRLLAHRTPWGR